MNSTLFSVLKVGAIVIYLATAASFFVEALASAQTVLFYITVGLFVLHIAEYIAVKGKLDKLNLDDNHFVKTFLFGFLHWAPLLKK